MENLNLVSGYNWQYVFVELMGIAVWVSLMKREKIGTPEFWHTLGLFCHSLGGMIRILFWAVASGQEGELPCGRYPNWACDYNGWLFWSIQLANIGLALMIMPYLKSKLGKFWFLPPILIPVVGFIHGAF